MEFIESHKRLEMLCRDVMKAERGIKAYYDEMEKLPRGEYLIRGWKADLYNLKHFNWVRNQIAHKPGCTEENMCDPDDFLWLDDFYNRIINGTDPLTLYRKATEQPSASATQRTGERTCTTYNNTSRSTVGCAIWLVCVILILVIILVCVLR